MKFWLHPSLIYKLTQSYRTEKDLFDEILRVTNMVSLEFRSYACVRKNIFIINVSSMA